MRKKLNLHQLVEDELEAPSLAWNALAWYWGLSFLGMAPSYMQYMQSDDVDIDKAFNDESNEDVNHIYGYERRLTIKERFDRAVNFYEYCCIRGRQTSINPPWDYPPDIDTLIAFRQRMEANAQNPDALIQASVDDTLATHPDFLRLWNVGGKIKREQRAKEYNERVLDAINYVRSELAPRFQLSLDQLNKDTGFLDTGFVHDDCNVTAELMDETMSEETQWDKLGECYVQKILVGSDIEEHIVTTGIIGRYWIAGHNLESAMFDDERKRELAYAHNATVRTWQQLMLIASSTPKPTEEDDE